MKHYIARPQEIDGSALGNGGGDGRGTGGSGGGVDGGGGKFLYILFCFFVNLLLKFRKDNYLDEIVQIGENNLGDYIVQLGD